MFFVNRCSKKFWLFLLILIITAVSGSPTAAYAGETVPESGLTKALAWLQQNQNNDGSWGIEKTAFVDTSEACAYLHQNNLAADNLQKAALWAENLAILNNDMGARVLPLILNADKHNTMKNALFASQNQDGGWGIAPGYESDILDTIIVMNSLAAEADTETAVLHKAGDYLIQRQQTNGSWSFTGNQNSVISLTAQAAIALSSFQTKTNTTAPDLHTALRKAGEYLVSVQQPDTTWGTDVETIAATLLSYQAVLTTVGPEAVAAVDSLILNIQSGDGCWYGSPYLTALALRAIQTDVNQAETTIQTIKLLQDVEGTATECYSFEAFETFAIQTECTYNPAEAELLYFVKQKNGSIISVQTDGLPGWNTQSSLPGDYAVIVQVKDKASGRILATAEKAFVINPSFRVSAICLTTDPQYTTVGQGGQVRTAATIFTAANIDQTLNLKLTITNGSEEVRTETKTVLCQAEESLNLLEFSSFTPDVKTSRNYTLKAEAFEAETKLSEGEVIFQVKPTLPPTRIDATQSLSKTLLYPGPDSVSAQIKLSGEGTPETTQRKPIDLIFCLDDSGSMEWGDKDYTYTKPWRIDIAKEASLNVVDLLQTQDRGAAVEFAGSVWIQQDLTGDMELLKTRISQTPFSPWDGTDIASGLSKSMQILDQKSSIDRDKIILLLSDGESDRTRAINKANEAKAKGYRIYTIALGAKADQYLMSIIAQISGGKYAYSPSIQDLNALMSGLAGAIFNTAGQNVVLETTLPASNMTVDPSAIVPAPTSTVTNTDGSKTLQWTLERLLMAEDLSFKLAYTGTDLIADTTVPLTKNTKLTYLDQNNTTVTLTLPDLVIPVSMDTLDSTVTTDKTNYTANEQVTITNISSNLTSYPATLSGKAEILDAGGVLVTCLSNEAVGNWEAGETKTMNFLWDTGTAITGSYKARITWSEGTKVISIAEAGFEIAADAGVSATVTADKQEYSADQDVNICVTVQNKSTNKIAENLTVVTKICAADGTVIQSTEKTLPEILPSQQTSTSILWNTEKNIPGQYTVTIEVYDGTTKLAENTASLAISALAEGIAGISGSLQIGQKNIYPADEVYFTCTINNTGNVALNNATARIRIVDTATASVLGILSTAVNLDIAAGETSEKIWNHDPLETGTYMVVLDALLADGTEVSLASSYLMVENPYETTLAQAVRPRVLVWAESQSNISLAQNTLNELQVYYTIVNTRESFMSELRTGKYNIYMLLDSKLPLIGDDDQELAAEVAGGKGLIATMDANGDNLKNLGVNGVKYTGNAVLGDFSINFPADSAFGAINLNGAGKIQNVELNGGTQIAAIQENATTATYPGVVTYTYQNGKSVLFSFNLGSCTGNAQSILKTAVEQVAPANETNSGLAELEIKAAAQTAIGAKIQLNIPPDSEIVWVTPVIEENSAWQFNTATGQEYTFRVLLKLPETSAQYPVTVDAYYDTLTGMLQFDTAEIQVTR
ncbi:MAG TPA: VWA domain-containing protein [Desulfitobacteriaceae bacterium]|nr:VWA domain-containing protein [Desulfitobacteriaceae bacterium]